ncbi:hypothetical protein CPHO_00420 [Corynebacterium phocae]|uniref:PrsW family intramembrane metalloprotease n=1 Tax=Corynebacterium phocae TaxID=161895 RepID=A0A1L7D0G9_9CORY|nr:PrsW family intramembrane metalloprotease [Corynebacterium phocae]APT91646.1 hypothetical protein CPHO_00420 [Corynebacterium phocae]KAA8720727.1 PrsW family intramembrane metalloprotease [Corynebacterium phocae]
MSAPYRYTLILSALLGALMLGLTHIPGLLLTPELYAISIAVTAVYTAVVIAVLSRSSLWPRGGKNFGWVLAALLWGSGMCALLAYATTEGISELVTHSGWHQAQYSFGGAYPEEISKALGVILVCMSFSHLNRPWHGLIVGMMVGLGFQVNENIFYASFGALADPISDWTGFWITWLQRLFLGPFLHIFFTGLAGWGIGWALFATGWTTRRRLTFALGWFAAGFITHFLWNYNADHIAVTTATATLSALILYPATAWVWIQARRLARQEQTAHGGTGTPTH